MKKYKIGYTTGVFDMFHIGHLNILKRAKERCEHLIVGISTDELTLNYKNKKPIIPFEERCAIVSAIKYVDKVVPQEDMDKISAVKRYNVDAVFVGSDWKGTTAWLEYEKQKSGVASDKIRIAFWGFIRHEKINRELIKKISKDERFELHYYGREQQVALNLKQYTREINAKNIFFHGEYKPEDRYEFVRTTDIIHNVYNDANMMLAMGNKYYDAAIFYIPIMSMRGAFMADMAGKAGIGFDVDPYYHDFLNKLFEAYSSLNKKEFYNNCDKELERVLSEYNCGSELIRNLVS